MKKWIEELDRDILEAVVGKAKAVNWDVIRLCCYQPALTKIIRKREMVKLRIFIKSLQAVKGVK